MAKVSNSLYSTDTFQFPVRGLITLREEDYRSSRTVWNCANCCQQQQQQRQQQQSRRHEVSLHPQQNQQQQHHNPQQFQMESDRIESYVPTNYRLHRSTSKLLRNLLTKCIIFVYLFGYTMRPATLSPVFMDSSSLEQFQSGRNIRHLPCIVRKSGRSGVCMFAIDCIKQNGTHLGTCIDRFYFGSCCDMNQDNDAGPIYAAEIGDNSIDQNIITQHHIQPHDTILLDVNSLVPLEITSSINNHSNDILAAGVTQLLNNMTSSINTVTKVNSNNHNNHNNQNQMDTIITTVKNSTKLGTTVATSTAATPVTTPITTKIMAATTSAATIASSISTLKLPSTTAISMMIMNGSKRPTKPASYLMMTTTTPRTPATTKRPLQTSTRKNSHFVIRTTYRPNISISKTTTTTTMRTSPHKTAATAATATTATTTPAPSSTASATTVPASIGQTTVTKLIMNNIINRTTTRYHTKPTLSSIGVTTWRPNSDSIRNTTKYPLNGSGDGEKVTIITKTTVATPIKLSTSNPSTTTRPLNVTLMDTLKNSTKLNDNKVASTMPANDNATTMPATTSSDGNAISTTTKMVPSLMTSTTKPFESNIITKGPPSTTATVATIATVATVATSTENRNTSEFNENLLVPVTTLSSLLEASASILGMTTTTPMPLVTSKPATISTASTISITKAPATRPTSTMAPTAPPAPPSSTAPTKMTTTTTTTTLKPGLVTWSNIHEEPNDINSNVTSQKPGTGWIPVSTIAPTTMAPNITTTTTNPIETTPESSYLDNNEINSTTILETTVNPNTLEGLDFRQICGRRMFPEPRIVGGSNAAFGRWPWQISLRQWRTSTYLHKCGAALLNENWAITAAHCVDNVPPSDLLLRLGEYDLAEEEEPYGYQERRVQIVASHPQFDPRTFEYDLALLRFYEPVQFQPNIIPVCVPNTDENFIGQTAFVTGWGRLYEDGPLPSVLQEVAVPVINNTICESMYRTAGYIEHIPHIFICAGWKKGGYDSCEGDSGGPMVLQRESDKRFHLGGVISWGIGCAEANQPGVYTRISEFRDWINQILQF